MKQPMVVKNSNCVLLIKRWGSAAELAEGTFSGGGDQRPAYGSKGGGTTVRGEGAGTQPLAHKKSKSGVFFASSFVQGLIEKS